MKKSWRRKRSPKRLWNGRIKPHYDLLNLDLFALTDEELEAKRITAKEEAEKRRQEKKNIMCK